LQAVLTVGDGNFAAALTEPVSGDGGAAVAAQRFFAVPRSAVLSGNTLGRSLFEV
jgi:4-aminobutyrate aminotransferase-like enzyme